MKEPTLTFTYFFDMIGALAAEGPCPEYADKMTLFGRLAINN
jgi:hypothetical protein